MQCEVCGLEMVIYEVTDDGPVYVCRNKRCPAFDRRLKKPKEEDAEKE